MVKLIRNNRSQAIFVSMMVSILALIVVVILVSPLKQELGKATNGTYSSNLNSSDPDISVPNKATVIFLDMGLFYFVSILIAISISYISGRNSFVGVITSIMLFVTVTVLISPLKSLLVLARDSSHLDCASATLSVGQSLSCIFVDLWLFVFVVVCLSVGAGFIFIKTIPKK